MSDQFERKSYSAPQAPRVILALHAAEISYFDGTSNDGDSGYSSAPG